MKRIVISGGPCSGKTTSLPYIYEHFADRGMAVRLISETATELIREGRVPFGDTAVAFHAELIKRQIAKEDAALPCDLMVCDRGAVDIKAYLGGEAFAEVLESAGYTEEELRGRYHAVFHMVTAAYGAEEAYSLSNNEARSESVEYAREVDSRTREAWKGTERYHIIDNSTDFEGKVRRLIECIEGEI